MVDLVVAATLLWIASGLYMWVRLKRLRFWGWLCLGGGLASFLVFLITL